MTHAEDAQRFLEEVEHLIRDAGAWVRQINREGCAYMPIERSRLSAVPAEQDEPDGAP